MSDNLNYLLNCTESSLFQRKLSFRIKTTLYVRFIVKPQCWMVISGSTDYQWIKSVHLRWCVGSSQDVRHLELVSPEDTGLEVKKMDR